MNYYLKLVNTSWIIT